MGHSRRKEKQNKVVTARLVARGFKECGSNILKDILKETEKTRPLKNVFSIGTEFEHTFRYLRLNITQKQNFNIMLDQIQFIHKIKSEEIPQEKMKNK